MIIKAIYGDYYHAAAPYARSLESAVEGLDVTLEHHHYPPSFDPTMLDQCDLFVLCKEGVVPGSSDYSVRWMRAEGERAIEQFVANGGTLFGWHSGLASYDPDGPIHAMYGGHFHGHPPQHEFRLKTTGLSNPACPDEIDMPMTDELYTMTVTSETADIWLEGISPENGTQPVGWSRKHGKGTCVCFSLAHEWSNLSCHATQRILRSIVTG